MSQAETPSKAGVTVDVVMPVFCEAPEAIEASVAACLCQSYPVSNVFVVDDGSPEPIRLPDFAENARVRLIRLPKNRGIAGARNAAISMSTAPYIACVNVEILPEPDWLRVCLDYLLGHRRVGACFTRVVPKDRTKILTRWRMRFHEQKFPAVSGPSPFAPGHAVVFRRQAVESVEGYNEGFRRIMEDSDIAERMWRVGWEVHYVAESSCVSIQKDSLRNLAQKQLIRDGIEPQTPPGFWHILRSESKWLMVRLARNTIKGRLLFLPVDLGVWAYALWLAPRQNTAGPARRNSRETVA